MLLLYLIGIPALSLFIQKCFEPDMIFRRWFLLLTYIWMKNWRKKDRWKRFLLGPLGLCPYCNSTWLSIIFFFLFINTNIYLLPLYLGLNYIILEIMLKIL